MSSTPEKRTTEGWAKPVRSLEVTGVEAGSPAINVAGRRPTSPIQGFGRMWQKTYRVLLVGADVDPREVIAVWKQQFGSFWPKGNRFFAPLSGIAPGEVAALDLSMPGADEALDRRARDVRRRGVVHPDDAAGPHVRRLDHVQRVRRRRRRGLRPGAGADARVRSAVRGRHVDGRAQPGGSALEAHAAPARPALRRGRRADDRVGVRRQAAPVVARDQRVA